MIYRLLRFSNISMRHFIFNIIFANSLTNGNGYREKMMKEKTFRKDNIQEKTFRRKIYNIRKENVRTLF